MNHASLPLHPIPLATGLTTQVLSRTEYRFTLLRRKPRLRAEAYSGAQARVFRPWMNARRVPFEAPKERSRVCFGGFRPTKHVEEPWALAHGAPLL
jgi:hypothetical protein